MRTRLRVRSSGGVRDVVVTCDGGATVGQVAALLAGEAGEGSLTVCRVDPAGVPGQYVRPDTPWVDCGLASGDVVSVTAVDRRFVRAGGSGPVLVRLRVLEGPDAGLAVDLPAGVFVVGRAAGSDVVLSDREVSGRHARLVVGSSVQVVDVGSLNGVLVDGGRVERASMGPDRTFVLGRTVLQVERLAAGAAGGWRLFNRSPSVVARYGERVVEAPSAPVAPSPGRFPWVAMLAPLAMGAVMYAVTRSVLSLVFVGLAPVLMVGTWLDKAVRDRSTSKAQRAQFGAALDQLDAQVVAAHEVERAVRVAQVPDTGQVLAGVADGSAAVWSRTRDGEDFLAVHLGLGRDRSRTSVKLPARGNAVPDLWLDLTTRVEALADLDGVPLVVALPGPGSFGVAGPGCAGVARSLVVQLVGLHPPGDLSVVGFASPRSAGRWDWLKWLPHVGGPHSVLPGPHLAAGPAQARALVAHLEELVAARRAAGRDSAGGPAVLVVVEDDAAGDRGRLVRLAEQGPGCGVHVLWCADAVDRLPVACRAFVDLTGPDGPRLGRVGEGSWTAVAPAAVEVQVAEGFARTLSAFVDTGAPTLDESDVPARTSWLASAGPELAGEPAAVLDRWRQTGSLPGLDGPGTVRTKDAPLRALVGAGADGGFVIDLREQGPHALVGGTTGSGKSEFLQTWVLALAAAHSPARVTFLLVDYKGGSAFADCMNLPHCVGLVTDLSPHLVRRALTSLRAELRARERLLAEHGAKDLLAMERTGHPATPPALVIVVDEFAALAAEVPAFVDGMIDIAQRGRSLGLHLILATQRPAGVIKDNLRANTPLRVALRMADEHDSTDVLGTPVAARFDPGIPGRAALRTGPDRVAVFQTGYVGGATAGAPPPATIEATTLVFGQSELLVGAPPAAVGPAPAGPSDIARVVATIGAAAASVHLAAPARPWLPELGARYDLAGLGAPGSGVGYAVLDDPAHQVQRTVGFDPDGAGSLVVYGAPGSGKSTTLRTVATALVCGPGAGTVHVYAVDAGAGALRILEGLPQVGAVIDVSDRERLTRLVDLLVARMDERATRFAAAHAATLPAYRAATGTDEPRLVLLLDGVGALREAYETDPGAQAMWSGLTRILVEGRALGVHVVAGAERPAALPTSWASAIGTRLVLRQADENTYTVLGIPKDVLGPDSPPGRAVLAGTGQELQVATPGGSGDLNEQAAAVRAALARTATGPATVILSMPTLVRPEDVDLARCTDPVVGLGETTDGQGRFLPVTFAPTGAFMLAGGPGSGRSTVLTWLVSEVLRTRPGARMLYAGNRRSTLLDLGCWEQTATSPEAVDQLARTLAPDLGEPAGDHPVVLVVENLPDFLGGAAEQSLTAAIRAARRGGHLVIAEAETPAWSSGWPLIGEVRNTRRGLILQPDQVDGDALFRVPFPRQARTRYPPGRGLLVERGTVATVQVPLPEPATLHPQPG